jgi:hypothetical protein
MDQFTGFGHPFPAGDVSSNMPLVLGAHRLAGAPPMSDSSIRLRTDLPSSSPGVSPTPFGRRLHVSRETCGSVNRGQRARACRWSCYASSRATPSQLRPIAASCERSGGCSHLLGRCASPATSTPAPPFIRSRTSVTPAVGRRGAPGDVTAEPRPTSRSDIS